MGGGLRRFELEIAASPERVYACCTGFEDFARFLPAVRRVEPVGASRLSLELTGVTGRRVSFEVEIIEQVPGKRFAWRGVSSTDNAGEVDLSALTKQSTRFQLSLRCRPRGRVARLADRLGWIDATIWWNLRRFRRHVEESEPGRVRKAAPLRAAKALLRRIPQLRGVAMQALSLVRKFEGPRRLARQVPRASPLRIVVGAAGVSDPGWIATEAEYLDIGDERAWARYFEKESIDAILAEHVFEHLTPEAAQRAARHCHAYLKPGGYVRAAVPDGLHPDPAYIEWVRVGGIGPGARDHKVLYDHPSFSRLFADAGFEVRLLEYYDEDGVLHQEDWDPARGRIRRSSRFDGKVRERALDYSSIILDAVKKA